MNAKFDVQHKLTREQHKLYLRLFYQLTLNRPFLKIFLALLYAFAIAFFYYWLEQYRLFHPEWAAPIAWLVVTPPIVLLFTLLLLPRPRSAIYTRFNQKAFTDRPTRFIFTDSDLRIFPLAFGADSLPPPLPYEKIAALYETDDAFYLLNPLQAGNTPVDTVIPKCALANNSIREIRAFIEEKTNLTFQPLTEISAIPALPVKSLARLYSANRPSYIASDYVREDNTVYTFTHKLTHEQHRQHVYLTEYHNRSIWRIVVICFVTVYLLMGILMLIQGVFAAIGMVILLTLLLLSTIFDKQFSFSTSSMLYKEKYEDAPVRYDFNEYTMCITFKSRWETPIPLTYSDILHLAETEESLHLLCSKYKYGTIIALPKSALAAEDLNKFKAFLTEKTGQTFFTA